MSKMTASFHLQFDAAGEGNLDDELLVRVAL